MPLKSLRIGALFRGWPGATLPRTVIPSKRFVCGRTTPPAGIACVAHADGSTAWAGEAPDELALEAGRRADEMSQRALAALRLASVCGMPPSATASSPAPTLRSSWLTWTVSSPSRTENAASGALASALPRYRPQSPGLATMSQAATTSTIAITRIPQIQRRSCRRASSWSSRATARCAPIAARA
jgi:hypothetical protein